MPFILPFQNSNVDHSQSVKKLTFAKFSQKLKSQIETIQDNSLSELKTMVDLGSQFYVQAHM